LKGGEVVLPKYVHFHLTRSNPKDMQKAIPSLYPSWLFSWAIVKCWL
jgi:hypothetical protein